MFADERKNCHDNGFFSPKLVSFLSNHQAMKCLEFAMLPGVRAAVMVAGVAVIWLYQRDLKVRELAGERSWRSTQSMVRLRWAQYVMKSKGYLYAIQALRNAITANTFLATTVLSLFTLCVGYLFQILQNEFRWLFVVQFGSAAACLLGSAFCFSQSARLMTHAGFMFPVAVADDESMADPTIACATNEAALVQKVTSSSAWTGTTDEAEFLVREALAEAQDQPPSSLLVPGITEASAACLMVRSEFFQWAGLRCLYNAVPCIAWILCGEYAFLVASFMLVKFLKLVDKPVPSSYRTVASWQHM
eukprot:CAMPEP_0114283616 /NCGR_PEP_ID=MMETSP0059-20121206/4200_1 /TAXON_ID=36894 /ORGANISM="Pyramimonas parkeae, Strain CCMP726" /LENGTH=303 /DNA_ID=CAMNT_0001404363 /DNA_START=270 /DNA_END=1181 /DNA_ORIENTATION=-